MKNPREREKKRANESKGHEDMWWRELSMSWEEERKIERKFLTRLGSSSCSVFSFFSQLFFVVSSLRLSYVQGHDRRKKRQMKQLYRNLWLTQSTHKKRKFFFEIKKKPWITKKLSSLRENGNIEIVCGS